MNFNPSNFPGFLHTLVLLCPRTGNGLIYRRHLSAQLLAAALVLTLNTAGAQQPSPTPLTTPTARHSSTWFKAKQISETDVSAAQRLYLALERTPGLSLEGRAELKELGNKLAQFEVNVARFYLAKGAYLAALNRAQFAIANYHDAQAHPEALLVAYTAYTALGMLDMAKITYELLEDAYPSSAEAKQAKEVS